MKTNSQRGVALILTLILLAVITFLTVAFLALSRRERAVVTVVLDQTRARQASETATERAKAQLIAQILATTNKWNYGLTVSTNYINTAGFQNSGPMYNDLRNVSYQYPDGRPLSDDDLKQNIANLYYDPRPPVVVLVTNYTYRASDFRYYLDFNRNQRFDTNGLQPVIGPFANVPFLGTNGTWMATPDSGITESNRYVGDPEWIGMLDKLGQRHDAKNRFIARYAFLAVPAGKTLDLNAIHNQAKNARLPWPAATNEGFLRNQGMGSWEINLAAALTDLNTNSYPSWNILAQALEYAGWGTNYFYDTSTNVAGYSVNPSTGLAFDDARELLRYRYNGSYTNLLSAKDHYLLNGADPAGDWANSFTNDFMDEYANGPLLFGTRMPRDDRNDPSLPWSGADNPNAFFTPQELFDLNKAPTHLVRSLLNLGTTNVSLAAHDRYTFYRLLSVLGTDSGVEPPDLNVGLPSDQAPPKINLNFDNRPGVAPLTEWVPEVFFTNAADRLLRDPALHPYYLANLSITNIPVWPLSTNYYTPSVHRLLQVAANLYDATTTNFWPSVFRPIFRSDGVNIFIVNYHELPNADLLAPGVGTMVDPSDPAQFARIPQLGTAEQSLTAEPMLAGVPLIIGAKKGLPNFNEFSVQSVVLLSRKLQFTKNAAGTVFKTNQMYFIGVSNMCGVEAWNSYTSTYPHGLKMSVSVDLTTVLSNQTSVVVSNRAFHARGYPPLVAVGWPTPVPIDPNNHRYQASAPGRTGFFMPLRTNTLFIPNCQYWIGTNGSGTLHEENALWPVGSTGFPIPKLTMLTLARVRFSLVDTNLNRIVDYVNLDTLTNTIDITAEMIANSAQDPMANVWQTNRAGGSLNEDAPTLGIINQIRVSEDLQPTGTKQWNDYNASASVSPQDKAKGIDAFREFMGMSALTYSNQAPPGPTMQAPFNPTRRISVETTWQVNDPLVHYTAGDLGRTNMLTVVDPPNGTNFQVLANLGVLNKRTQPWGGHPDVAVPRGDASNPNILQPRQDQNAYNLALKDPQIRLSDDWEFPTNKFGNVGAIGRVHRGTPWQTVYLKAPDVAPSLVNPVWQTWCGNWDARDAVGNRPVNDRFLFEHFTVAPNANATRGQLSINSDELAAWSAVLSGVQDLHSALADSDFSIYRQLSKVASSAISPAGGAGWNSALGTVVGAINRTRADKTLFPALTFTNLGNLLTVPELTTSSPFLTSNLTTTVSDIQRQRGLTDAAYERIPQQIMSLLRGNDDPRFVIYAYGQSLQPAPGSIVTDDPHLQLCTNYAITAESAVRTVVRIIGAPKPGDLSTNTHPKAVIESFNFLPPD